jgi:hypothetical protein
VSIPIISAELLPDCKVNLQIEARQENIKPEGTNVFGRECNQYYAQMPTLPNLNTNYGINPGTQTERIIEVLKNGGIAVPLVHPNTLYEDDNPSTKDFLHAVVLTGFNEETQTISVMDPGPGFSRIPEFTRRKIEGKVRIPSNRIRTIENADKIASKYHPKKSVLYEVTPQILAQSLRFVSTTITR